MPRPSSRTTAARVLIRVEESNAFAAAALTSELRSFKDPRDAALTSELVYGVLRHRSWLDSLLEEASTRGLERLDPRIRTVLRIGAYQIVFLERIPARAAVYEAVATAKALGRGRLAGLVNALLRKLSREEPGAQQPELHPSLSAAELAVRGSQPEWLVRRFSRAYGPDRTVALLERFNEPAPRCVRLIGAPLESSPPPGGLPGALSGRALRFENPSLAAQLVESGGAIYQDEGSQLVALALEPGPNQRILDACAGRGGKTAALADLAGGRARILAADRSEAKLERLAFELGRRDLDAETFTVNLAGDAGPLTPRGSFDRILLDAPCSGTGTLGRRPEIRWRLEERVVDALVETQQRMISNLTPLLAPGGRLVYATCSLLPEEGARQLERVAETAALEWVPEPPDGWPTAVDWNEGRILIDPARAGTDGYQICVLRRPAQ